MSKTADPPLVGKIPIWRSIRESAERNVAAEPMLASFLHATILN
ncbi:MAG: serine O-acetyltransferase, partial [Planctomyces sp.]